MDELMSRFRDTLLHRHLVKRIKEIAGEIPSGLLEKHLFVIYLKHMLQFSHTEIQEITGITTDHLKWILRRYKIRDSDVKKHMTKIPIRRIKKEFQKLLDALP